MTNSGFPLDRADRHTRELSASEKQRPTLYACVEPSGAEASMARSDDSLLEYWRLLVHHRMTLLVFAAAGLLGAILFSLVETPIYRARTSIEIQGPNYMQTKGPETGDSAAATEAYVETQIKLLQSESLLELVIDKLKLQNDRPTIVARIRRLLRKNAQQSGKEELVRQIQRNLTVRESGNSRLVELLYESPDPKLAADFANALVSEFIEQTQEMRWKAAQGTADWLTNHLDKMKAQLEASEAQLQEYARTSGLQVTTEKDSPVENRLNPIQDELSRAQADRIAKEAKLEEARTKPVDSLPDILEDPTMRDYRQRLAELQRQYAELSATLTPQHYKVQRIQAQINELKSEMERERSNVLRRIGTEYAAAVRREKLLSETHASQEKVVAEQSSKAIHYDTLKRDVDTNRRLYETMLQQVKEASLNAAMRDSSAVVIDRAKPPFRPYKPSLPMNSAIGLLSGIFLGFGFMLLRERIDHRISAPGEAQVYLDLPELGVIPLDESALPMPLSNRLHLGHPVASFPAKTKPSLGNCPELATWKRRPSLLAECARTTLTSILLPSQDGIAPKVVVLTSARPGDGKTTVACNLSIAMAEIGRKVLLIDGDLRRPRLHTFFNVSNQWGLGDVLWGNLPLDTVPISQLVRETEVPCLFLMPAGSCGVAPANLFFSPRMSKLLERTRTEFDMVMIDAPPMIHLADARVLGRHSDGVILVVRAGETTTEGARYVSQRFAEDGTRILGTVLNSWDPRTSGRSYDSYRDYQTYAGH